MSRQQRAKRRRLPPDLWAEPHRYLAGIFGPGYEGVVRDGDCWGVQVDGRVIVLGHSGDVRGIWANRRRLNDAGVLVGVQLRPEFGRDLLNMLRRARHLSETGAHR